MPRRRPPQLFDAPAQDGHGPESDSTYELVAALRAAGFTIHRAGALHVVDGRHLTTKEFVTLAASLGIGPTAT